MTNPIRINTPKFEELVRTTPERVIRTSITGLDGKRVRGFSLHKECLRVNPTGTWDYILPKSYFIKLNGGCITTEPPLQKKGYGDCQAYIDLPYVVTDINFEKNQEMEEILRTYPSLIERVEVTFAKVDLSESVRAYLRSRLGHG